ncbi:MAG: ROK family protein [Bacteroidota bacterium]
MNEELAIGIDLGGTTVKAGIVTARGNILQTKAVSTHAEDGPSVVIERIEKLISELLREQRNEVAGIGIGSPGVVTLDGGMVKYPPNLPGWTEIPLGDILAKKFDMPVAVENDANAAAIAESRFGAGKGEPNFLFIIWGTGVGGGIIMDGKIYRGPSGGAGEIGHMTIDPDGPLCNCGNRGCVEAFVGQRYLSQRAIERIGKAKQQEKILDLVNGKLDKIEPAILSAAAEAGDILAREILIEAGVKLGIAIASALNLLDFRLVIIGGGISAAPEFVYEAIRTSVRDRVLTPLKPEVRIIRASLGNMAGILGAAALILDPTVSPSGRVKT